MSLSSSEEKPRPSPDGDSSYLVGESCNRSCAFGTSSCLTGRASSPAGRVLLSPTPAGSAAKAAFCNRVPSDLNGSLSTFLDCLIPVLKTGGTIVSRPLAPFHSGLSSMTSVPFFVSFSFRILSPKEACRLPPVTVVVVPGVAARSAGSLYSAGLTCDGRPAVSVVVSPVNGSHLGSELCRLVLTPPAFFFASNAAAVAAAWFLRASLLGVGIQLSARFCLS